MDWQPQGHRLVLSQGNLPFCQNPGSFLGFLVRFSMNRSSPRSSDPWCGGIDTTVTIPFPSHFPYFFSSATSETCNQDLCLFIHATCVACTALWLCLDN